MTNRIREVDWSQFELRLDEHEWPTIILKRTNKPVPIHILNGRYLAICTKETNTILLHRAVYFLNEIKNGRIPNQDAEIHHKNENKMDCRPSNLEALDSKTHRHMHPEVIKKMRQAMRDKWANDPEFRERMTENLKRARAIRTEKYRARKAAERA